MLLKVTTHHNSQTIIVLFKSMRHGVVQQFLFVFLFSKTNFYSFVFKNIFELLGAGKRLLNSSGNLL